MFAGLREFLAGSKRVVVLLGCSVLLAAIGTLVVALLTFPSVRISRVSFKNGYTAGGFLAFLLPYAMLAKLLVLGPGFPYAWHWYLLYVLVVTLMFRVEGRFFHLFLLPAFPRAESGGRKVYYVIGESLNLPTGLKPGGVPPRQGPLRGSRQPA